MPPTRMLRHRLRAGVWIGLLAGWLGGSSARGHAPAAPQPLTPAGALAAFRTPADLAVDLIAAEPAVRQPLHLSFDARGRLWVVQYLQYPEPAGLKMLSRDGVWRIVYDGVPAPPPGHVRGADKITVHEDTDGDGSFETMTTFVDGLNLATAVTPGKGGVWVLNPPYLLFYPDADADLVPDGDPVVHLEGFHLEDTHSIANSLTWGPDGWLYGAQGSTVSGDVMVPGSKEKPPHTLGQLVWRYHPESKRFEVFAEGGGNAFGLEFDDAGRLYSGHNGGNTRGFAYVQGGYFQKGFDKHGPLSNPYAFGYFPAMKHPEVERFTHTFVIEGGALPERYRGQLFGVAPLLNHVVISEVMPDGSTVQTRDAGFALTTADRWFRPVDIKAGPDGALYIADWYDGQVNHYRNHEGQIDKERGRVYRLRARDAQPSKPTDLNGLTTEGLIERLGDPNRWTRATARRLLGERHDPAAIPPLLRLLRGQTDRRALEALWALNLVGGLDDAVAAETLEHANPHVRRWTIRLLGDRNAVTPDQATRLAGLAATEPDVEVRSQLASTARRLPADQGLPMVRALLVRDADATDPHLPLLLWWAIEAKAESDRSAVVDLFRDRSLWAHPIVRRTIAERVMRRYAATGRRADLETCATLLELAPGPDDAKVLLAGLEAATAGGSLPPLPEALAVALAKAEGGSMLLGVRRGQPGAIAEAVALLADPDADRNRQLRTIQALGETAPAEARGPLLDLARRSSDNALRSASLAALAGYSAPEIGTAIVAALPGLTEDVRAEALAVLASRPAWGRSLVAAIEAGTVDRTIVPPAVARRLAGLRDEALTARLKALYGDLNPATPAALQARIADLGTVLRAGQGDPRRGEAVFGRQCGACHTLFAKGGKVGPDLTAYQRTDVDGLLLSLVNPSAEIREGYAPVVVATRDGRSLAGILVEQDARSLVLRTAEGRDLTLGRDDVDELAASPASLMPEGLLDVLKPDELRDLFAYLRSTQPPK